MPPPRHDAVSPRSALGLLAAIACAGLAVRLAHLYWVVPVELGPPPPAKMDRWLSMQVAAAIAGGDWLGGWAVPYDSSPAYSYLLAALYRASGARWLGPLLLQAVLGAATPLVLAAAVRRLYGGRTAIVAALLAAFYVPAIFYESLLVKFAVIPFTTAGLLLGVARVRDGARWGVLTGVALGAVSLLRPNVLLVAPVVLAWTLAGDGWRTAFRRALAVASGLIVVLGPMAVRDALAARAGLGTALGGLHFYIGTNPAADGEYVVVPGIRPDIIGHVVDAERLAEARAGRNLSPGEVSRFWLGEGVRFIREQPARYALLEVRKVWFALEANEMGSFGDDFDELQEASPVLRLPAVTFALIAPLALLGLGPDLRRRESAIVPLLALAMLLSLLPFFVAGRYRLPLVTPMIAMAAASLARLDAWRRRRRWVRLAIAIAVVLALDVVLGATDVQLVASLVVIGGVLALLAVLPSADQSWT